MRRIVFVNPPISPYERYGALAEGGDYMPPLGLCYLAAMTRRIGYQTQILDCEILRLSLREATKKIISYSPNYVGLTATTLTIQRAAELAANLKRINANLIIIIGGPHISALPEETMLRFSQFDIGVLGEGEMTIIELLNGLSNKLELKEIMGLVIRDRDKVSLTMKRPPIEALDALPLPSWDLLPTLNRFYTPPVFSFRRWPVASLITSRGCPGRCTFCDTSVFGRKFRYHNSRYVGEMIRCLKDQYGIREIIIYDDNFLIDKKRVIELCELLISGRFKMSWSCNARIDMHLDREVLSLMKKAGCWMVCYGIEAGSQKILDFIQKGITKEMIRDSCALTRGSGIKVKGYFMFGAPLETKETLKETMEFLLNLKLDAVSITYFTPFPGTIDYKRAQTYGRFDNNWKKITQHKLVFVPNGLNESDIEGALRIASVKFYFRPRIFGGYLKIVFHPYKFLRMVKGFYALVKFIICR